MTTSVNIDAIMNQPGRVQALRRVVETVADGVGPLVDLYRPYVDRLENCPAMDDSCWWATIPKPSATTIPTAN